MTEDSTVPARAPRPPAGGLAPGDRVAGYTVEERIGAGGMAVVYRARDEHLGRAVALKVMMPRWSRDRVFRARFTAEASAAATVDHPNVIEVYEAGDANGVLFIAMRLVSGGDLKDVLDREGRGGAGLPPDRVLGLLEPAAAALDAVHAAGLVHRDIKPANILLDRRPGAPDHVYVSDFGLIKGAASGDALTPAGQYVGTPHYSAPEQVQGRALDGRADQYALACVAFELLSGRRVFERDQALSLLMAHMSDQPPPLSRVRPGLTAADRVLARALAKAPADRYPSCGAFLADLRAALIEPDTPPLETSEPTSRNRWLGRVSAHPARAVAASALLAAVIAVPVWLTVLPEGTPARPSPTAPPSPKASASAAPTVSPAPTVSTVRTTVTPGHGALLQTLAVAGIRRVGALAFAPQADEAAGALASGPLLTVADGGPGGKVFLSAATGTASERVVQTFADPAAGGFRSLAFSPGGLLAAAGNDGAVDVWNVGTGARYDSIPARTVGSGALSVAFGSDGTLAVGGRNGTVFEWDEASGPSGGSSVTATMLPGPTSSGGVTAVAFASDGTLAAGYGNGDSYVWGPFSQTGDASVDSPTISYADYGSAVTSVAWAGTGTLAVAHADGQVPVTPWTEGEPSGAGGSYAIPGSAAAVGWTTTGGDNMLAAGGANGTAYVWDDSAGTGPAKDVGLRGVSVTALSFVPGGAMLAAGGSDGKVRLWKVTPYQPT